MLLKKLLISGKLLEFRTRRETNISTADFLTNAMFFARKKLWFGVAFGQMTIDC